MMKKGFLRIVCLMLMGLLLLPPMAVAEGAPKIVISAPQGEVGETVQVVFSAKDMPACSSMEMVICYDTASLKPLGYEKKNISGLFYGNIQATHAERAAIKLTAASMGMTGQSPIFSGDAELFSIDFEIIGGTLEEQGALVELVRCDVREDNAQTSLLDVEYAPAYVGVPKAQVTAIEITKQPTKTTYLESKESLDLTDGVLTVYYDNNASKEIPLSNAEITGFDNERIGKQTLTATYEGFTAHFEVEVTPLMLLRLEKPYGAVLPGEKVPVKVEVLNYSPLSGLSIGVTYDPAYLKLEEQDIIAANLPGLEIMTSLQSEGDRSVAKIVWMGAEEAWMEETFTALTLNFTAIQENPQEDTDLEVSFLEGGMVNNNGEFKGYLDMPSVTTIGLAKVAFIAMKNLPDLLDYPQNGGAFNPAGGVVALTYENGHTVDIPLQNAAVSGFDNTTPGKKILTVSYCGKTTVFEVDIMGDPQFSDVRPNDWFYSMVQFAKHKGLMKGDPEGTFRPDDSMTRAELVTMFYRLEGEPSHSGRNPFHDVHASDWYYDEILWAAENGIVNGKGEGLFAPADRITRQELVTLFHRYAQKKGLDGGNRIDLSIFADRATIDSWAADPVQWAVAEGLVVGIEEGAGMIFAPKNTATRAQVATIMMRYIQKYKVNV